MGNLQKNKYHQSRSIKKPSVSVIPMLRYNFPPTKYELQKMRLSSMKYTQPLQESNWITHKKPLFHIFSSIIIVLGMYSREIYMYVCQGLVARMFITLLIMTKIKIP